MIVSWLHLSKDWGRVSPLCEAHDCIKGITKWAQCNISHEINVSNLLQHVQYEFLEDFIDAHGHGLTVHVLAKVAHPQQLNQLPDTQAVLLCMQLQLVVCKVFLTPSAPHDLHQLSQEVLNLRRRTEQKRASKSCLAERMFINVSPFCSNV